MTSSRPRLLTAGRVSLAIALCAVVVAASVAPSSGPIRAQARARRAAIDALRQRLGTVISGTAIPGEGIGVSVVDATSGEVLFDHAADQPRNPASNLKLVTAAALLEELGPEFRITTLASGDMSSGTLVGPLMLRGAGDPLLTFDDIASIASDLHARGITQVSAITIDAAYFDDQVLPPAFDQDPDEAAAFRAPVSALSVDRNAYTLTVVPAASAGTPAQVTTSPVHAFFELRATVTTTETGPTRITAREDVTASPPALVVEGTIARNAPTFAVRRRVPDPRPYALAAVREAFARAGIAVAASAVTYGPPPQTTTPLTVLASHRSPPLSVMLLELGKQSDNFVAETLLKVLGAERRRPPGRTSEGLAVLRRLLTRVGVPAAQTTLVNGSGLYTGNAIAPRHLTRLLSHVYRNPAIRSEYLTHLAVAGIDGTLSGRNVGLSPPRVVRAKTGTLDGVIALSGYVLGRTPNDVVAFSVLLNGVENRHPDARALADAVPRELVRFLYEGR